MYSEEDLDSAVAAGAITADTAAALRAHVAGARRAPNADEEYFRLVSGFNDIFVVIAICLLVTSVAWIGHSVSPTLSGLMAAAVAWGLSEFFVRVRRMALPAIFLLLAFVYGAFFAVFHASGQAVWLASAAAAAAAWLHWQRFHVPITVAAGAAAVVGAVITTLVSLIPAASEWISSLMFAAGCLVLVYAMKWDALDISRQ